MFKICLIHKRGKMRQSEWNSILVEMADRLLFFRLKTHPLNNKCNIDVRALDGICSFDGFHFYNVHSYYDVRSQEEPVWRRGLFQYINFN